MGVEVVQIGQRRVRQCTERPDPVRGAFGTSRRHDSGRRIPGPLPEQRVAGPCEPGRAPAALADRLGDRQRHRDAVDPVQKPIDPLGIGGDRRQPVAQGDALQAAVLPDGGRGTGRDPAAQLLEGGSLRDDRLVGADDDRKHGPDEQRLATFDRRHVGEVRRQYRQFDRRHRHSAVDDRIQRIAQPVEQSMQAIRRGDLQRLRGCRDRADGGRLPGPHRIRRAEQAGRGTRPGQGGDQRGDQGEDRPRSRWRQGGGGVRNVLVHGHRGRQPPCSHSGSRCPGFARFIRSCRNRQPVRAPRQYIPADRTSRTSGM